MQMRSSPTHFSSCFLFCFLLAACDEKTLQEAAVSDGWTTNIKHSQVQGDQFVAQSQVELDSLPGAFRQITVTCTQRTKKLVVELGLYGDARNDPTFTVTQLGGVMGVLTGGPRLRGSGVAAGSTSPVDASEMVALGGFKNVAFLRQTQGSTDMAHSMAAQLPLAVELESNFGTIAYEIPKSQKIIDVINHCLPSQAPVEKPVIAEVVAQPNSPPAASQTGIPMQIIGKPYSVAHQHLQDLGFSAESQTSIEFSNRVANDAAQCGNAGCSIPWHTQDFAFCVGVQVNDNVDQQEWVVTSAGPCESISDQSPSEVIQPRAEIRENLVDSEGVEYQVTETQDGRILKSENVTIYLGNSCDAYSPQFGTGTWGWANGGVSVELDKGGVGFPRQESPFDDSRCPL